MALKKYQKDLLTLIQYFFYQSQPQVSQHKTSRILPSNVASQSEVLNNNPRKDKISLASKAMDPGPLKKYVSLSVQLKRYEESGWWSSDKDLLRKHGPLLFFKDNEKVA